jgi:predicted kinase
MRPSAGRRSPGPVSIQPTLLLTCGLPGAGKTTLARRLAAERDATRLTKDEWVLDLGGDLWDDYLRDRMEAKLIELAFELLAADRSCILDFGLWSRAERDALRLRAREAGVRVELHFLDEPLPELLRRNARRYAEAPQTAPMIPAAQLADWAASFEAPTDGEIALYDEPPPAS